MENVQEEKKQRRVDNSSYVERYQFQLLVNNNIICQRYFKISHFNYESLTSEELFDALGDSTRDGIVNLIKEDLKSKSRIYLTHHLNTKTKLTGFAKNADGTPVNEVTYAEHSVPEWDETEIVNPWDVTFKFMFLVDDKPVYEHIWDGSQYPKYVRNSVDITNGKSYFPMVQLMNIGKSDLVAEIIRRICAVCSNDDPETPKTYTKSTRYSNSDDSNSVKYNYSAFRHYRDVARDMENNYRSYFAKKYSNR